MNVNVNLKALHANTDDTYNVEFLCRERAAAYVVNLAFKNVWHHKPFEANDQLFINTEFLSQSQHLLRGTCVSSAGSSMNGKKNALVSLEQTERTVFFSFPNEMVRQIFFLTMKSLLEKITCPAEVQYITTVGYPTIALHFQAHLITQEQALNIGYQIIQAIAHWDVIPFVEEKMVTKTDDDIFDTAEVVEMELEEELQEQVNQIRDKNYIPPLFIEDTEVVEEAAATGEVDEVFIWGEESFLRKPVLTKAYALKSTHKIPLHEWWDGVSPFLDQMDETWIKDHLDYITQFAFATELMVIRNALGALVENVEDEEVLRRHGNILGYISQIDISKARIITEDSQLGTLYVFPGKADHA
jgi:hypothetical protein